MPAPVRCSSDQLQMLDELREHQDLVAAREQLVQGLGEGGELGACRGAGVLHETGIAAREPQPREVREELQATFSRAEALRHQQFQVIHRATAQRLVQRRLGW